MGADLTYLQTFLQGGLDGAGAVTMRANQTWSGADLTKIQGQVRWMIGVGASSLMCLSQAVQ